MNKKGAGRKPLPKAVLLAKGTYRNDRHSQADIDNVGALEFVGRENLPMPPEHFDKELQKIWTSQLFHIGKTYGWVGFVDLPMFEQWCLTYRECQLLKDVCYNADRQIETDKGVIINPIFKELREAQKLFAKISSEFGLTPSSRRSISLAPKEDKEQKEADFKL